jgi:hypothetical protein
MKNIIKTRVEYVTLTYFPIVGVSHFFFHTAISICRYIKMKLTIAHNPEITLTAILAELDNSNVPETVLTVKHTTTQKIHLKVQMLLQELCRMVNINPPCQ